MITKKLCHCGNYVQSKGVVNGKTRYSNVCTTCKKNRKKPVKKKRYCEACGFIALHPCQIDLDHIDGNKANETAENLWSLCSNCHRLKTFLCNDWSN